MDSHADVIAGVGLADAPRKSRWPARMDLAQSLTGLVLGLFMWGHMFFVSSILVSKDAMWTITKFFEGYFFFGKAYPGHRVVHRRRRSSRWSSLHAFLAMRKFPANYRQYRAVPRPHEAAAPRGHHALVVQVVTGFVLFFLATAAPLPDADAPRHRPATSRPTASGAAAGGRSTSCCCSRRAARRHRPLPAGGEVGLVRGHGRRTRAAGGSRCSSGR